MRRYHARDKFDKLAEMNGMIDDGVPGVLKAKKKLQDTWTKRTNTNVQGFWKASEAKKR